MIRSSFCVQQIIWRTFSFEVGGETYEARATTNGNQGEIGNEVLVYFDPDNPKRADIHSPVHHILFGTGFPLVGAIFPFVVYFAFIK